MRFNLNWRPITFDFLSNNGIERRGTKIKVPNMSGVTETLWKIYIDPQTLKITQIIQFRSFFFLNKSLYKRLFVLFLNFWLKRWEREGSLDSKDERESHSNYLWPPKWIFLVFTCSIRWEKVDDDCLESQCYLEKKI